LRQYKQPNKNNYPTTNTNQPTNQWRGKERERYEEKKKTLLIIETNNNSQQQPTTTN